VDEHDRRRAVWTWLEPLHAITYFAPEALAAFESAGLRGFWRGYFAGRAAPLGAVGVGVVTATFFGFHPSFVARAVPSIWERATPAEALDARRAGVDAVLGPLLAGHDVSPAVDSLRRALDGQTAAGRPLYAANADLPWPTEPHLALWHACTLVREHRGDGHVAALVDAGIDGCEAHVLRVTVSGLDASTIQPHRGWSDDDWAAATDRLRARGQLDAATHADIEAATDRLAVDVGADALAEIEAAVRPVLAAGIVPYPNAMGVPAPA
jgi:hypothetical protein